MCYNLVEFKLESEDIKCKNLAAKGESVLVVEKSKKMYGGTFINFACLPSKKFIFNAQRVFNFYYSVKE